MILVGTAGFRYPDWKGPFYPERIRDSDLLAYYASRFRTVELDFTYYAMPTTRTMASLSARTPPGFHFCVKANKAMTHDPQASASDPGSVFGQFLKALQPMVEEGKLGCILAQFPYSFKPSPESRDYILRLRDYCEGLPVVVEYRNRLWARGETIDFLRDNSLGFCCVDEPRLEGLMPPVAAATSSIGYVRFHGRNAAKWWHHEHASERYDYLYSQDELMEWVPKIKDISARTEKTYVIFNNCHAGKAARNSLDMLQLLGMAAENTVIGLPGLDGGDAERR